MDTPAELLRKIRSRAQAAMATSRLLTCLNGSGWQALGLGRSWRGRTFLGVIFETRLRIQLLIFIRGQVVQIRGRDLHSVEQGRGFFRLDATVQHQFANF